MKEEEGQNLVQPTAIDLCVERKVKLTVDEVVEEHIGSVGVSQLIQVFVVSLALVFDSQNTLVTIFTDALPETWKCMDSSCNTNGTRDDPVVLCMLVGESWQSLSGNTSSIVAEWNLLCDQKFIAAVPGSLFFLGSVFGSIVCGILADSSMGRKRTLFLSCMLSSVSSFLTSLSPNIWIYVLLRFLNGFFRSGIGICCLVLSTEIVGRQWRGQIGQYGFFFFTIGFLSLPLIAYQTRTNWRNTYRIISIFPLVYSVIIIPFISESPRWLLVRGKHIEAINVLKNYATLNGKQLPNDLSLVEPSALDATYMDLFSVPSIMDLFNAPSTVRRMICIMVIGFCIGFVYYGIQFNVGNLKLNIYITVYVNACMEIPAVVIGGVLLGFMKRRVLFSQSACMTGVSCFLCIIFTHGKVVQVAIESFGFMASSIAFDVLYILCVELFPTTIRSFAISMLRLALTFGASVAPLLVVAGRTSPSISFFIFGILCILGGLLSLQLPETRDSPLYNTLEEQKEGERINCVSVDSQLELGVCN